MTIATSACDIANLESIVSLDGKINSSELTRWEKRQLREKTQRSGDRFIPNRGNMDMTSAQHALSEENENSDNGPSKILKKGIMDEARKDTRVLSFRNKAPVPAEGHANSLNVLYTQNRTSAKTTIRCTRNISSAPVKILDAPDMVDDYYLNLIDWSSADKLAVALGPSVYLWDATTGNIDELLTLPDEDDYVCSLKWITQGGGSHIAVGTAGAKTMLWDAAAQKQVRSMGGHADRVGSLSWNTHLLSSGSRDSTIVHHDVRVQQHQVGVLTGHEQEVCQLTWSPDGSSLASGGNDNRICIWDSPLQDVSSFGSRSFDQARFTLTGHQAAVKALAWCPHERNLLASGGGTADRCIKFWNTSTGAELNSIDTGSQVCSLLWSPNDKEILSSHGFSKNELNLWSYPGMAKIKELTGHTGRALHLSMGPPSSPGSAPMVVSAGADETLRFWNIFGDAKVKKSVSSTSLSAGMRIR